MKKRNIYYILLIVILLLTACGKKAQTWQELYDLGEKYLLEENYEEAIVAFTSAIELDPKQAVIYIGRGDAYAKYQDEENYLELALADYSQALELDDTIPEAYLGMADVYVQQKNYEQALEILQKGQENTGASEIDEQIGMLEEMQSDANTEETGEESDSSENLSTAAGDVLLENEELTVIKQDERTAAITLKGLSIKDSYSIMDMDGQDFWLWEVAMYLDNGTRLSIKTDCENVFLLDDNAVCTIDETTQIFSGADSDYNNIFTEEIEMSHTSDSITWTFTVPEEIDFDFSNIKNYTVNNMVLEDPAYGGREYDANGNLTETIF